MQNVEEEECNEKFGLDDDWHRSATRPFCCFVCRNTNECPREESVSVIKFVSSLLTFARIHWCLGLSIITPSILYTI